VRAVAAVALSGRYAVFGRQAAAGLRAWADLAGADLVLEDDGSVPERAAEIVGRLAPGADLVFGPYGSGAGRAVAERMAGRPEVVWNHGAAALGPGPRRARVVDVLGPATSYWRGLADALGAADPGARALVVRGPGGYAAEIAAGAVASLEAAGRPAPLVDLDPADPAAAVGAAREAGATWVTGGGRADDDLALARELAASGLSAALPVCGVTLAAEELGDAVSGWIGPSQWLPGASAPPVPLAPGADFPAAQALAAGLLAQEALGRAGGADPDRLWDAARALRTATFFGPFAVDQEGRQTAHAPLLVRWTGSGAGLRREVVWAPGGARP
jgi:ABC-type branched-subunit amino acid transport system substrate-binding protein